MIYEAHYENPNTVSRLHLVAVYVNITVFCRFLYNNIILKGRTYRSHSGLFTSLANDDTFYNLAISYESKNDGT